MVELALNLKDKNLKDKDLKDQDLKDQDLKDKDLKDKDLKDKDLKLLYFVHHLFFFLHLLILQPQYH